MGKFLLLFLGKLILLIRYIFIHRWRGGSQGFGDNRSRCQIASYHLNESPKETLEQTHVNEEAVEFQRRPRCPVNIHLCDICQRGHVI